MHKIFSNIENNKLLHIVIRKEDIVKNRLNIISDENWLQCAVMNLPIGTKFKPHKHIEKDRFEKNKIAQESWIVIQGKVKCYFYDLDNKFICNEILNPGDASFTLYGGHTYEIMSDDTIVYEYKTGPYEGIDLDKVQIDA